MRASSVRIVAAFVLAVMLVGALQGMGRHRPTPSVTTHHAPTAVRGHHAT
ncbi:hypothetical protein [Phycicoccus sp. Soil748]|nr:hypothetical protein [Phycicoccus sp. Soil748]